MNIVKALLSSFCCAMLVHGQSSSGANITANPAIGTAGKPATLRVAAAQPRDRTIDWKITEPAEVLRRVDRSLAELEQLIHQAAPKP